MENAAQTAISTTLRQAFFEAQTRNPAYSLRSFAKRLAISPSALSEILNGKRRVSPKIAERLADRLGLEPRVRQSILSLFKRAGATAAGPSSMEYEVLGADQFAVLADWYHFAILSLMELKDFNDDPHWIATRLNIRSHDAAQALERLERLGLVKRNGKKKLILTKARLTTSDDVRSLSLRKAHRVNLAMAEQSLDQDPVELRDFCAMTMAINPDKLPEAKTMVREFLDHLSAFLETSGKQREVYKACVQIFPLSH